MRSAPHALYCSRGWSRWLCIACRMSVTPSCLVRVRVRVRVRIRIRVRVSYSYS